MTEYVTVAVSPHYNGRGWTDRGTGISFKPTQKIEPIRIETDRGENLNGIANSLRLNNLLLLRGTMPETTAVAAKDRNPEELTVDELETIVAGAGDTSALDAEILRLNGELTAAKEAKTTAEQATTAAEQAKTTAEQATAAKQLELETAQAEITRLEDELAAATAPAALSVGEDDLDSKTVAELKTIASDRGIDLGTATKKAEIIEKIRGHEATV